MPELARFFGIRITMYANDHPPPHFHARHAGRNALFEIPSLRVLSGRLPPRVLGLILTWAARHRDELLAAWATLRRGGAPSRIPSLE